MFSKLASLAVASCLCVGAVAQRVLEYDIPAEEALALSQIVEDEPTVSIAKGKEISPPFDLIYRVELPIPPLKQPKQVITNPVTGGDILYFEIEEKLFQKR
ncbi:hypothetical protein O1611_g9350 [Lasiodiplodia mahajangana]|uniref:Uncharacterized protein n=1 Tax=Lasiodiplodia mahajangana TaxID=1108764 RepID=A0ACC2JA99_9PEZI|nr:hypothetical protein O1611_g9350 [Lasiodiplodia mahajangana]